MKPIIKVTDLSKQYRIGARQQTHDTLRDAVAAMMRGSFGRLRRNERSESELLWAVKNVSFEVCPGEVMGIIGSNGAGKSTLLKILSRITEPTTGRVEIYGRIGSLLEVGTGFHAELTGRENIYLNGAVLGMKRREISSKFDEIVAFAEIGRFLDTPVKHYSSGMYMRLAFAVAAHLQPEILLVDEVLAVGDAEFQAKCLGKMGSVASEGRTILFVSHNMTAMQALCRRVIWIRHGEIAEEGPASEVVKNYLAKGSPTVTEMVWEDPNTAPRNEKVRLQRVAVRPANGSSPDSITIQTALIMEFDYWNLEPDTRLNLSMHLFDEQGTRVFSSAPVREPFWHGKPFPRGLFRSSCYIPGDLLNDGIHRIQLLVVQDQGHVILEVDNALVFNVLDAIETRGDWHGKWPGIVRPNLEWKTEYLGEDVSTNEIGEREQVLKEI